MSLFQFKSLWTYSFSGEEFDEKHFQVGHLNEDPCYALASYSGSLRLFVQKLTQPFMVSMFFDYKYENPIIQIKFVMNPNESNKNMTLGILFYRKFAFLTIQFNDKQYIPRLQYVDVCPGFGLNASPLCVVSLNGTIEYLNPPKILKIQTGDPIYPYLIQENIVYFVDGEELVLIEGSSEQWRIVIGRVISLHSYQGSIIAIGEHSLWEIKKATIMRTKVQFLLFRYIQLYQGIRSYVSKVLADEVSCGIIIELTSTYNILVCNRNHQMLVYRNNYELLWAMKTDQIILKVFVCTQKKVKGMIAYLTENGSLELGYTGANPPQTIIQPISDAINLQTVEKEISNLWTRLKTVNNQQIQSLSQNKAVSLNAIIKLSRGKESLNNQTYKQNGVNIGATVSCFLKTIKTIRNVSIFLRLPSNIICESMYKFLDLIQKDTQVSFEIFADNQGFPHQTNVQIIVRYQINNKPQTESAKVLLPLQLQCKIIGFEWQAADTNIHKLLLKSKKQLPSLSSVFHQELGQEKAQNKALVVQLSNGVQCALVYNKTMTKVKIQCEFYSGLPFLLAFYYERVKSIPSVSDLSVQIPLQEFFLIMRDHFDCRIKLRESFKKLQCSTQQFRKTEKKLLIRMKEQMSGLNNIDKLLQYTYDKMMESANDYESVVQEIDVINHNLAVAIKLVIDLLFIRSNPSLKAKQIATAILSYEKEDLEYGWEEKVTSNASYFLGKKYNKNDPIVFDQLQKIPLYIISKVNNGDWNM